MNAYAGKITGIERQSNADSITGSPENRAGFYHQDNRAGSIVQKKQVEAIANSGLVQRKQNNTGLPDQLKSGIESLSGHSMDHVKVHYNSNQPAQLSAHAYAQGTDIHIAPGQEKHLPHEAWHVAQQKQGRVRPTIQMKGKIGINDDKALEREAENIGEIALKGQPGNPQPPLKSSPSGGEKIVQRKVGVEYETDWKISGDNKANHKETIYKGSGWHMETDNNSLEFVVFPPLNSPEQLSSVVGKMSAFAVHLRGQADKFEGKTAKELMGGGIARNFSDQKFKASRDAGMSAKAQFSFGISMNNLVKLFDALTSSALPVSKSPAANKKFNFQKNDTQTTSEYLKGGLIKNDVSKSGPYRQTMKDFSDGQSPELKGFLAYLAYSIKAMETEYKTDFGSRDRFDFNFTEMNKAALLAQEIVKRKDEDVTINDIIGGLGYNEDIIDVLNAGVFGREGLRGSNIESDRPVNKLKRGLLLKLQKYTIKRTKKGMDYPKYRFVFMNRSGFDKMYQALSSSDQGWFRMNIDAIISGLEKAPESKLFASPYSYKTKANENDAKTKIKGFSHGPTLKEWLKSIVNSAPKKRDLMSPPKEFIMGDGMQDPDQSLGLLAKMDNSQVTQYELTSGRYQRINKKVKQVIIELRSWGDYLKPDDWPAHSYDMAYLFSEIASGDLNQDERAKRLLEINSLLDQREQLKAGLTKKFSSNRGQKTNQKNQNKHTRNQIDIVDNKISELRKKL
jgi:hypothetical protein